MASVLRITIDYSQGDHFLRLVAPIDRPILFFIISNRSIACASFTPAKQYERKLSPSESGSLESLSVPEFAISTPITIGYNTP